VVDNCDLFANFHATEPEVLSTTMTEIITLIFTRFTLSELIPQKGA